MDDFLDRINKIHVYTPPPSDIIFIYGNISCWYGQGGHRINIGLTMYVTIDRNPENGYEIYNSECGNL